jgi:serine/threonine protein kinase
VSERRDDDAGHADTIASDGDAAAATTDAGPAAPTPIGPGSELGRYLLGAELGSGGMATVYRARDRELRRDVAVKVLFPHLAKKAEVTRRFQREARAAAGLEHPNILRIYDVGGGGDLPPFIVMELVRGGTLRELDRGRGAAFLAELVACVGALVCEALAVAHAAGIVHRDVKPGNVMIADDGRLLLDRLRRRPPRRRRLAGDPHRRAARHAVVHGAGAGARSRRSTRAAICTRSARPCTSSRPAACRTPGSTAKIVTEAQQGQRAAGAAAPSGDGRASCRG